jgi:hypothetical protein
VLTVSGGRRWEAAEWSPPSPPPPPPPPPPPSGLPAPTDLGNTLDAYFAQPGGQTIVIPAGKHLTGDVVNRTHPTPLILLAETPGSVTADGCSLSGCTGVLLGGVTFGGSVWPADGSGNLTLWYCDVTGTSLRAGVNIVNHTSPPGTHFRIMGTDVHDCDHDGIKAETDDVVFQGGRMWNIWDPVHLTDPPNANHDDCYQTRKGTGQAILDFVFGMDKAGSGSLNGHTQIQSDLGVVDMTIARGWITASGNYPVTAGDKGTGIPCGIHIEDVYAWANNSNSTICNSNGAQLTTTRVSLTAPPAGTVAPDVAWQQANPYESAEAWLAANP